MMTLNHVGDREAMVYAQLGQQPLVRTTATPLQPRQGSLSCLRAQPPDLADLTVARPKVACVPLQVIQTKGRCDSKKKALWDHSRDWDPGD